MQNTVRVPASLYTANLGPLTAYQKARMNPNQHFYGVCWNQMSDQAIPSVQKATVSTGTNVSTINNRRKSVTSSRPGCQTPGGVGCDIKHNSYERYLNRLKGKGPLRKERGFTMTKVASPREPFFVYENTTFKTNIVNGCECV